MDSRPWWSVIIGAVLTVLAGGAAFYLYAFTSQPAAAGTFFALAATGFGATLGTGIATATTMALTRPAGVGPSAPSESEVP